jgi:hypothetical protein
MADFFGGPHEAMLRADFFGGDAAAVQLGELRAVNTRIDK